MVWFGVMNERGTLGRIRINFTRDVRYFQFHIFGELKRMRHTRPYPTLISRVTACGQVLLLSFNKSKLDGVEILLFVSRFLLTAALYPNMSNFLYCILM